MVTSSQWFHMVSSGAARPCAILSRGRVRQGVARPRRDAAGILQGRARYKITSADNYRKGLPVGLVYADSKGMLLDRVAALREASVYEHQTYRHRVGLPAILTTAGGAVRVETPFLVVRIMRDGTMGLFATGRYVDTLVEDAGALRFRERIVVCDSRRIDTLLATCSRGIPADQPAGSPALTGRTWPEILRAAGLQKNAAAAAMSSAVAMRLSGDRSSIILRMASGLRPRCFAWPSMTRSMRSPSMAPGATQLTVMLWGASSSAMPYVMPTWPALAEQ